ncbi:MAG: hypothetical protein IJK04_14710 [Kiritimatiellae bacterium]|nr:hypothetical protein [Kiritimatiellia bacterium]
MTESLSGEPVAASYEEATHYPHAPVSFKAGGTRLFSTLPDYTRFAAMLCGEETWRGIRILQPESVRLMATPSLPDRLQGEYETWGLSMRVIRRQNWPGQPLPAGCFGWSGAFETHFSSTPRSTCPPSSSRTSQAVSVQAHQHHASSNAR